MRCPYCDNEMEHGDILAPRGVYWVKKDRDFVLFIRKSKGDVVIVDAWSASRNESSYLCRGCGKVIIDIHPRT